MTTWTILAPGPSLARKRLGDDRGRVVAVNLAVLHPDACDVWCAAQMGLNDPRMDLVRERVRELRPEVWTGEHRGEHMLTIPALERWAGVTRISCHGRELWPLLRRFPWRMRHGKPTRRLFGHEIPPITVFFAVAGAVVSGARTIRVVGCDMDGDRDWRADTGEPVGLSFDAARWDSERRGWDAMRQELARGGVALCHDCHD